MRPTSFQDVPRHKPPLSVAEIVALLGPAPGAVVLEVGCHDGSVGRALAAALPGACVHAFECDPRALERFRAQPPVPGVTLHAHAVGAFDGRATFHMSSGENRSAGVADWDLSGSLKPPSGHRERYRWCRFERTLEVEVRRLDTWLASHPQARIDLIWLDVQGAEGDVFAGGRETLARTRFLYTEFNAWKKPLYEGDLTLAATLAALGSSWKPLAVYEGYNVLLANTAVPAA